MRIYDEKGRLVVTYGLHADEHEAGGADEVSVGALTGEITDAQHGVRTQANAHAHSHLSGIGVNDHHAQAHTLASHSTKAHTELTGVTSDQHHARSHDHSLAADGTPIAVAGVPDLPASKITSGQFPLSRMPRGDSGKGLVGKGTGVDPAYEYVAHAKAGGGNIWVQAGAPTAIATGDIWIET